MAGVSRWWPYSHHSEDYSLRIWHNKPLMMRLAKENLAQTTWFGITERFNESMCLFYYTHRLVPKEEGKDYRSIHRHVTQSAGEEAGVVTAAQYQKPRLGCGSPPPPHSLTCSDMSTSSSDGRRSSSISASPTCGRTIACTRKSWRATLHPNAVVCSVSVTSQR